MVEFTLVPERTALVNVDLQNVFVEGEWPAAPEGLAVLARVNRLTTVCRQAGILVIHTSYVLRPGGSNMGVLGEVAPPVREGMITKGSRSAAALHERLVLDTMIPSTRIAEPRPTVSAPLSPTTSPLPSSAAARPPIRPARPGTGVTVCSSTGAGGRRGCGDTRAMPMR